MSIWNGIEIYPRAEANADSIQLLKDIPSSIISDVMGGRLVGTTGLHPINRSLVTVLGHALTVRVQAGDNLLIHKALGMLDVGDVLVVDGEANITRALVGEIMMTTAHARGAVGFVIDGAVRDVDAFETLGFPCWARGINLRGPYKEGPGSINVPVTVGGMPVNPGDIVVGDSDGLVAVPVSLAAEVAAKAIEKIRVEQETLANIRAGTYSDAWVDAILKQKGF